MFCLAVPNADAIGRSVMRGWQNDQEEWRAFKLNLLRRKGKGPPKKGLGKRSAKKKK